MRPSLAHADPTTAPEQADADQGDRAGDLAVWDRLRDTYRRVSHVIEADLMRRHTLTARQLLILRHIAAVPGSRTTVPALRNKIALSSPDTSRVCHVLESRRLIELRRAGAYNIVTLTRAGQILTRRALETQHASVRRHLLDRLTSRETAVLVTGLTRINQSVTLPPDSL